MRYSKVRYIIQIPSSYVQYFKHLVSKQKKGKERKGKRKVTRPGSMCEIAPEIHWRGSGLEQSTVQCTDCRICSSHQSLALLPRKHTLVMYATLHWINADSAHLTASFNNRCNINPTWWRTKSCVPPSSSCAMRQ